MSRPTCAHDGCRAETTMPAAMKWPGDTVHTRVELCPLHHAEALRHGLLVDRRTGRHLVAGAVPGSAVPAPPPAPARRPAPVLTRDPLADELAALRSPVPARKPFVPRPTPEEAVPTAPLEITQPLVIGALTAEPQTYREITARIVSPTDPSFNVVAKRVSSALSTLVRFKRARVVGDSPRRFALPLEKPAPMRKAPERPGAVTESPVVAPAVEAFAGSEGEDVAPVAEPKPVAAAVEVDPFDAAEARIAAEIARANAEADRLSAEIKRLANDRDRLNAHLDNLARVAAGVRAARLVLTQLPA